MRASRPSWEDYYLGIAEAVSKRANCSRRTVGAVIVVNDTVVSTGYNGTPTGAPNCNEGGCARCAGNAPSGSGYDLCLCVHAEQNAISHAAKHGCATNGGTLYCTLRPCFGCLKSIIQAGITKIVYKSSHDIYTDATEQIYIDLVESTGLTFVQKLSD